MARKKRFWTPMKIIITIAITLLVIFFILKAMGIDVLPFLSTSSEPISKVASGAVGQGGGLA